MIRRIKENSRESGIKRIMKKNQVIIFMLALMLMTAGYMNYTNNHDNENMILAALGDAQLVSSNVIESANETVEKAENIADELKNVTMSNERSEENTEIENKENEEGDIEGDTNIVEENDLKDDESESEDEQEEKKEEMVDTNANTNLSSDTNKDANSNVEANAQSNYFTQTKLERESMYSQMLETYTGILENEKIASDQKKIAENEIKNINDRKNAIMIVENLLSTKGFNEAVVLINDKSVNVVVGVKKLETENVAQIQNIIQRELNTELENIHISSKNINTKI